MTTYTSNAGFTKQARSDRGWDVALNANSDILDAIPAVGGLAATPNERPSSSRTIRVAPGSFGAPGGPVVTFAGGSLVVPPSSTVNIWMDLLGALVSGSAWPAAQVCRVATVTTDATTVTSLADARVGQVASSMPPGAILTGSGTLAPGTTLARGNAASGALTVTLPSAATTGPPCRVIKVDASGNAVTVRGPGSETVNGASTLALASQWSGKTFVQDGANWLAF